ncbi:MAG: hypothetical protein WA639_25145 [Candidatus Acidiferrum sp.]
MSPIQREIAHREHDSREMLLRSAGKLFQDVGYVQASIYRIASAVNAPKGMSILAGLRVGRCRLITEKALREWLERKTEAALETRS